MEIAEQYLPLIGEVAWHSIIVDPRIAEESDRHYDLVRAVLTQFSRVPPQELHILEVASYAHTTGYRLAGDLGARVTLFEISRHSLRLGRTLAGARAEDDNPRLVAGDFHALPFEDDSFHLVYISSALHHTWNYAAVLRELVRVTAPGGLLFLENEPTERLLCCHKFRCNRLHDFTPFEKRLTALDMIRTVAEPYVGSRPEYLFGMIENQTIPLPELFGILGEKCEMEHLELTPEQCMGGRERYWLRECCRDAERTIRFLAEDIARGCREAEAYYGEAERGLGFALPGPEEIRAVAERCGEALAALPDNPAAPEYRYGISRLFGAPVRLVARKGGTASGDGPAAKAARFRCAAREDGIHHAYPEHVGRLLARKSFWPEVQSATDDELRAWFPSEHWERVRSGAGIVSLVNRTERPVLKTPAAGADVLVLLRILCTSEPGGFAELTVAGGGRQLFAHGIYKPETVLVNAVLQSGRQPERLEFNLRLLPGNQPGRTARIAVSYAGLFALDDAACSARA